MRLSERVPVLTLTRNMKAGEMLISQDLQEKLVLKEQVSLRAISPEDINLIIGRRLIHPVPAQDSILWTDFPEGPRLRQPSERIPAGYRMIALPADEIHTLAHFLSPGDSVDIVSSSFEGEGNRLATQPIAEKVSILSVGKRMEGLADEGDMEEYPLSISILVDPDTAIKIIRASQLGEVYFLARSSDPLARPDNQNILNMNSDNKPGEGP